MNKTIARCQARKHIPVLERCNDCGTTDNLERHHPDYDRPLKIDVLCRPCHTKWHNKKKAINGDYEKTITLKFVGNKEELHRQLKTWCAENEKSMNGTVMELIKKHLKK